MEGIGQAADGWEAALATALLGADRAPTGLAGAPLEPWGEPGPASDPGATLLARLAGHGVRHLAGRALAPGLLVPAEPRPPAGPECPSAAAARLALLLSGGARDRLAEWCGLAAAAGVRAPPWLVPALAAHRADLAEAVGRIAGSELAWLDRACADNPAEAAEPVSGDWSEGSPSERRTAFLAVRADAPEAARAALEAAFRTEKAEIRQSLVAALEVGLSEADAPFLEICLDDRASGVRAAAQRLLSRLPRSLLASRMAARAQAALAITAKRRLFGGTTHALAVTLPEESPMLARDGVEPRAYERRGGGTGAGLLREILGAAPLHAFAEHPPRLWIELALRSEWSDPIIEGFLAAVRREGDADWARALATVLGEAHAGRLSGVRPTDPLREVWARAAGLLPAAEWERLVEAAFRGGEAETILAHLGHGPAAFSERFTAAHLDWLAAVTRGARADRDALARSWMIDRLAERAHPDAEAAASAAALLARLPDETPEDPDGRLRRQVARLAETLELRAAMRREFEPFTIAAENARA
ncbi:DUF5691 domain-containing protein [Methylobacterium oxalidis]|uniref:Uncharacterized protein n=1 Tax=Methylobacterium oxalidis TaxID=944322 RepID=A0A512J5K0_9HYPH|nr:DUF5691 domain-containing protein [Methylobacterium oxalidis]GEP05182.1 hypothetical protein MOX02_32200 [Methylobacterium oxalidis]GJE34039.1 hypothetical protein LDDCCGHA_4243 [Methylobacterium oxalidis]GLS66400.1 hypothetical protein GCM10007888_47830 [Methylobacterium oxalidis]